VVAPIDEVPLLRLALELPEVFQACHAAHALRMLQIFECVSQNCHIVCSHLYLACCMLHLLFHLGCQCH
jgi:hypothetical protein